MKKPKFVKLNKKLIQLRRYSTIYFVARSENPKNSVSRNEEMIQLLKICLNVAAALLIKIKCLLIKFFKKFTISLLKLVRNHPWFTAYLTFVSCALLILHRLTKKFGRKLRFYEYLVVTILSLILVGIFAKLIQMKAFQTIGEWLKSILLTLLIAFKNITNFLDKFLDKHTDNLEPTTDFQTIEARSETSNASNAGDFQKFFLFSLLTVFTTRFLLLRFKRKLVGESPFTDIIIDIVDFVPDDPPVKKLFNYII